LTIPVVGDAPPRIEAALVVAVGGEARLGHLDDQDGCRGVPAEIIAVRPWHDGQVWLRLRLVIEGDRLLLTHDPAGTEGGAEGILDETDGDRMRFALGLGDTQLAPDQLDGPPRA
jgi:hypothetical protein